MASEHLNRIFRHNRWANLELLKACASLDDERLRTGVEGTYGELGRTLAHLASAEAGYAWRFDQNPDRFRWNDDQPVPPVAVLAGVLDATGRRLTELAVSTPDDHEVVYRVEGEERRSPAWVVLGQVIDHGREHRSHVATILTQLGVEPPEMDMWAYGDAVASGAID